MDLRGFLKFLVAGAVVLPIVAMVVIGAARLLAAMRDAGGAAVLDYVALAVGIFWTIDLVILVVLLAIDRLDPPNR
jgi:hypothetical protein